MGIYCREPKINPLLASVLDGINFLGDLYQKPLSYSAIKTACSALSTVIFLAEGGTSGNNPPVARFLVFAVQLASFRCSISQGAVQKTAREKMKKSAARGSKRKPVGKLNKRSF